MGKVSDVNEYEYLALTMLEGKSYISDFETYEMVYMNESLLKDYNMTEKDFQGRKCYEIIAGLDEPCKRCKNEVLTETEFLKWYDYNSILNQHLALKEKLEVFNGRKCHVATAINISNEDSKKKELKISSKVDKNIIRCAKTLLRQDKDSMYDAMEILAEFYDAKRAYIFELNHDNMIIECVQAYSKTHLFNSIRNFYNAPFSFEEGLGLALFKEKYIYTENLGDIFNVDCPEYKMLKDDGTQNLLLIPLNKDGKFFGFVGVEHLSNFDGDIRLLVSVSAFVLNNIYKTKAIKELEIVKAELNLSLDVNQTLVKCATMLLEDTGIDKSINLLLQTVTDYYGAECSYIFEWDESEQAIKNDFSYVSEGASLVEVRNIDKDSVSYWFRKVKEKNLIFLDDSETNTEIDETERDFLSKLNIKSMILAPLERDGTISGILGCDNVCKNLQAVELLRELAKFIMADIEKKQLINELEVLSYTDKLTGLYNRNYYLHLIDQHKKIQPKELGIVFGDVNGLKKSNDNLGHEYGDILLKWCAGFMKKHLNSPVCRIGGDEFVCLCENVPQLEFDQIITTMRSILRKLPHQCMSIGTTWSNMVLDVNKQIIETDRMMYLEKQHYYAFIKGKNLSLKDEVAQLKTAIKQLENDVEYLKF